MTSDPVSHRELVSIDDIRQAAGRIAGIARRTPLLDVSTSLPPAAARPLLLKCENLQVTGAFKIRGAANTIAQLDEAQRRRGVITYSSGNHGLALSYAATLVGIPAVIVMPTTAPAVKVDGARRLGAQVIFEGTTTVERKARAEKEAHARGLTIVPPFDHPAIIAGQGTIGLEILEDRPDVRSVYVPMSGGGLISGIASAVKQLQPGVRVVGVEPARAPKMTASLAAGQPVTIPGASSLADGLLAVRPGDITFPHVRALVDRVVTIDETAIAEAVRWLFSEARLVVEPSGAIGVAAVLADADRTEAPAVAVLSGGNVSPDLFAKLVAADYPSTQSR